MQKLGSDNYGRTEVLLIILDILPDYLFNPNMISNLTL
jgi:hypothetical protein